MLKESWITDKVEIYTTSGWVNVTNINKISDIVGYENETFTRAKIKSFDIRDFNGKLPGIKEPIGNIHYHRGKLFTPSKLENKPETTLFPYVGKLYHLVTSTGNYFIKSKGKYILCEIVG